MQIKYNRYNDKQLLLLSLLFDMACLWGCVGMLPWGDRRWIGNVSWAICISLFLCIICFVKRNGPLKNTLGHGGLLGLSLPFFYLTIANKTAESALPLICIGLGFCLACVLRDAQNLFD